MNDLVSALKELAVHLERQMAKQINKIQWDGSYNRDMSQMLWERKEKSDSLPEDQGRFHLSTADELHMLSSCKKVWSVLGSHAPIPVNVAHVVKNPPASAGETRDVGSIPELGRAPGGGHGNPLQYSCLENPMEPEEPGSPPGHKESDATEAT